MAMFDLAVDDDQTADAYEQAGIVYMGLGRWEEAQVNFEAADALLHGDIRDPALPAERLNRKLTLMTNLGSLMAKRGNASWAVLFGQQVADHPRATPNNRGWGLLVQGEASLAMDSRDSALDAFEAALACFEDCARQAEGDRARKQARGNALWARVHVLYAQGDAEGLADLEAEQVEADPEVATMAGLFHALCLRSARRKLKLRDVQARARRHGLGEIAQRATRALAAALVVLGLGLASTPDVSPVTGPDVVLERGNTGGGK
jgi:tetratricopeptide (TPR) repeat protein